MVNSNLADKTTAYHKLLTAAEINDATITVSYTGNGNPEVCKAVGFRKGGT